MICIGPIQTTGGIEVVDAELRIAVLQARPHIQARFRLLLQPSRDRNPYSGHFRLDAAHPDWVRLDRCLWRISAAHEVVRMLNVIVSFSGHHQ